MQKVFRTHQALFGANPFSYSWILEIAIFTCCGDLIFMLAFDRAKALYMAKILKWQTWKHIPCAVMWCDLLLEIAHAEMYNAVLCRKYELETITPCG